MHESVWVYIVHICLTAVCALYTYAAYWLPYKLPTQKHKYKPQNRYWNSSTTLNLCGCQKHTKNRSTHIRCCWWWWWRDTWCVANSAFAWCRELYLFVLHCVLWGVALSLYILSNNAKSTCAVMFCFMMCAAHIQQVYTQRYVAHHRTPRILPAYFPILHTRVQSTNRGILCIYICHIAHAMPPIYIYYNSGHIHRERASPPSLRTCYDVPHYRALQ